MVVVGWGGRAWASSCEDARAEFSEAGRGGDEDVMLRDEASGGIVAAAEDEWGAVVLLGYGDVWS